MEAADFLKTVVTLYKLTRFNFLENGNLQSLMMFGEERKGNRTQFLELKRVKRSWGKLHNY